MRHVSDAALELIKRDEGLRLKAYTDQVGVLTIGYGHTGPDVTPGETITEAEALALLKADLRTAESAVDAATRDVATTDAQFSAMVSLAFNIGTGAFKRSSVLKKHRAGDHAGAGAAFLLWDKGHVDGELVVIKGLLVRRNQERAMYLSGGAAPAAANDNASKAGLFGWLLGLFGHRPAPAASPPPAPATQQSRPPRRRPSAPAADSASDNEAEALNAAELAELGGSP